MDYSSFPRNSYRQDTLILQPSYDTAIGLSTPGKTDTFTADTHIVKTQPFLRIDSAKNMQHAGIGLTDVADQPAGKIKTERNPFLKTFNTSDNYLSDNSLSQIGNYLSRSYTAHIRAGSLSDTVSVLPSADKVLHDRPDQAANWLMLVFISVILLFIWIRIFYNKFFSILSGSLLSYQLSVKTFREKNVLLKRVSFILDIVYLVVLSLFVYELFTCRDILPLQMTSANLFLLIFNILVIYTLIRGLLLKLFSFLFRTESVISEYVHNNYIINKGIGIVLFPLVFVVCYIPEKVMPVLLWAGLLILGTGVVFKIIRGYQIIIRKDVLFIYLILYLCTLEILPLLLGYKVFMSLL